MNIWVSVRAFSIFLKDAISFFNVLRFSPILLRLHVVRPKHANFAHENCKMREMLKSFSVCLAERKMIYFKIYFLFFRAFQYRLVFKFFSFRPTSLLIYLGSWLKFTNPDVLIGISNFKIDVWAVTLKKNILKVCNWTNTTIYFHY